MYHVGGFLDLHGKRRELSVLIDELQAKLQAMLQEVAVRQKRKLEDLKKKEEKRAQDEQYQLNSFKQSLPQNSANTIDGFLLGAAVCDLIDWSTVSKERI